jgi:hypothetical protein
MKTTGRQRLAVLLVVIAVVGTATVGSTFVSARDVDADTTPRLEHTESDLEQTSSVAQTDDSLFQTDIDADAVEMVATLDEDGDANWRVVYRLVLDTEEAIQGFEELAAAVEENTSAYLAPFEERLRLTADTAREATDRQMTVQNFSVRAEESVQPDTRFGEVTFEFEWDGFAPVDGEQVRAGDALDSLFLDEQTSLTFRWTDRGRLTSHTPDAATAEDGRVVWRGPREFDRGEPRATVQFGATDSTPGDDDSSAGGDDSSSGADDSATGTDDGTTGTDGATGNSDTTQDDDSAPSDSDSNSVPTLWVVVASLGLVALGTGVVIYLRQETPVTEDSSETQPGESDTEATDNESGDEQAEPPDELLSNEEQVLKLVDDHGGRIKQKKVADELDWSAARTSQVVSTLREENRVETFRIGRENVLTLPDVDIMSEESEGREDDDTA